VFIDVAKLAVEAGKGGDGCVSTRREKHVPRGGPDGGNGGRGGSIILVANPDASTLLDFRYRRQYRAGDGAAGSGRKRTGADGADLRIPIPCGTSVYRDDDDVLLGDLLDGDDELVVARGGRGGKGNWEFRSARNQTPLKATPGRPGEALAIRLELKLIADIGLVGAPNAGKSTLLSVISAAQPKIADYPFTTLVPNLGIVALGEYASCTVADIPGLIAGASAGKGLGHEFLRHVERTRALLLMCDPSGGPVGTDLGMLRDELTRYGHGLAQRPFAVVLTKSDLIAERDGPELLRAATDWAAAYPGTEVVAISAVAGAGLDELRRLLSRLLRRAGPVEPVPDA
jgi:GTP-binding protein